MILQLAILILSQSLFNVINAYFDAYRIFKNKTIGHGVNFGIYAAIVATQLSLVSFVWWYMIIFGVSAFCNRQITFDIPLNLRRGKDWDYISLDKPPKAITDRIEISFFGYNGSAITFSYIILWGISIGLLVIFY